MVGTLMDGQTGQGDGEPGTQVPEQDSTEAEPVPADLLAASTAFLAAVVPAAAQPAQAAATGTVPATAATLVSATQPAPAATTVSGTHAQTTPVGTMPAPADVSVPASSVWADAPKASAAGTSATPAPTGTPTTAPATSSDVAAAPIEDADAPAPAAPAVRTETPAPVTTQTTTSTSTAPAATTSSTSAAAAPAPTPATTAAVTTQVFDAISKLVARPDGSHRVTLKLNPAELGEVKVIMTTRQGTVRVELQGSEEATAALRTGTHELFKLLDATPGTTSTHISVRDSATSTTTYQSPDQGRNEDAHQAQQRNAENLSAGKRTGSKDPATDGPFVPGATSSTGQIDHDAAGHITAFDVTV